MALIDDIIKALSGWDFWKQRPNDLSLLPLEPKRLFLQQALKDPDEDKRGRAKKAFEE